MKAEVTRNQISPDEAARAEIERNMRLLRTRYLEKMHDTMLELEALLALCESKRLSADDRAALKTLGHKLAGTGATYGFAGVSTAGRALDDLMKADPHAPFGELMKAGLELLKACRNAQLAAEPATRLAKAGDSFGKRLRQSKPGARLGAAPRERPVILVADDDEAIRNLFTGLFSEEAEVITAENTAQALELMRLYQPDIVLLDDIMPNSITGLKMLEMVHKTAEFQHIPIVMITASDSEADIERGLNAGAADYITKPFEPEWVGFKVRRILNK